MQIFLANTLVSIQAQLKDYSGNPLSAQSVSYRVVDMHETELVPMTAVTPFVPGSNSVVLTTSALVNTIAVVPADSLISNLNVGEYNTRESRTIEIYCLDSAGNTFLNKVSYGLESSDPLRVAINTFQLLPSAELSSIDIYNTPGWDAASNTDKVAALIEAWNKICQLNFWLLNSNTNWGQDNMNYVPDGVYQSPYVSNGNQMFIFNGNLALLTPTQYGNLPYRFRDCLSTAQVAEADYILGGDPIDNLRVAGVVVDTVGQSKQMFRQGKALDLPVSKRTLKYLSPFVTFAKRIGRG